MTTELHLTFPDPNHFMVKFDDEDTEAIEFIPPYSDEDRERLQWYLEQYPVRYMTEIDDQKAEDIADCLQKQGEKLFEAVFTKRNAQRIFNTFQDNTEPGRMLTVSSRHPEILSLPWELLRDTEGVYLFNENPRISIRRKLSGARGGRRAMRVKPKNCLNLLFVVSRPDEAAFLDPRTEPCAVMDALELKAADRVNAEFLRPATLQNLVERLEDDDKPLINIIHFDGHGAFDHDGSYADNADKTISPDTLEGLKKDEIETAGMGYLLFEEDEGSKALVSAAMLGEMLHRKSVSLVVLSACQSAVMAGDDAMGSVAARLTHAGIPAVLAMTHSVLIDTTRALFGAFYENLVKGKGIGQSLDNARRRLFMNPDRGERQRGKKRITLKLHDWFLPALYQSGKDTSLLTDKTPEPVEDAAQVNLPALQEAGFFGRTRELWDIERAFVHGTRRFTISGFGGQGKTYLAIEAGLWLCRTGMFEKVCFVDYAAFQGVDAVSMAVSTLSAVLEKNLTDAKAAKAALKEIRTLLILDNLESLQPEPLQELLSEAKPWSEAGESRVLITTRMPDFGHPDYPAEASRQHIVMQLKGLGQEDCLTYFQSLMKLPPKPAFELPRRDALLEFFKLVDFHPLSIGLLAKQLKTRRIGELGKRLEELVKVMPDNPLLASLNLSLEKLDQEALKQLPGLGVFQGGAMEHILLEITEFSEKQWQKLRPGLETTGLIEPEHLSDVTVPYLKFHPTLAPALWQRLSSHEQDALLARHRQEYYDFSGYLYNEDKRNPHQIRAVVLRELANLLFAVNGALDAEEEYAVEFVNNVNWFLNFFGLRRDRDALSQRAQQEVGETGSRKWYLARSNLGEQLLSAGRYRKAAQVFEEVLAGLDRSPSYERCLTLTRLGQCLCFQGQAAQAVEQYRKGLATAGKLEPSDILKRHTGVLHTDLADALTDMGDYEGAKTAYEKSLSLKKKFGGDSRGEGVVLGQLGTLAMRQGNLKEATKRHLDALAIFRQLNEPEAEAVSWHQLGIVYRRLKQWDAAEQAYRQSAQIEESRDNLKGAAESWGNLAGVMKNAGKLDEAEAWYRKALKADRRIGNKQDIAIDLSNLADLLQTCYPFRLSEARLMAEEALAIRKTIDPGVAEIWKTYNILAKIAEKQKDTRQAKEFRKLAREAWENFEGAQYELQKHAELIAAIVAAVKQPEIREQLKPILEELEKIGWNNLVAAIRKIWDAERNEDVLCEPLGFKESMIVSAVLAGLSEA
ncbi:tetratricopeptide repeat protein [Desulfococcaceae bacterium HSG9]|nr:tetratricopeptide repeat protein [Desulfococcaceae bacterium HSG9]